jgi:hypothetical protein
MALRNTRRNKWNLGMGEELHSSTTLRDGRSNDKNLCLDAEQH